MRFSIMAFPPDFLAVYSKRACDRTFVTKTFVTLRHRHYGATAPEQQGRDYTEGFLSVQIQPIAMCCSLEGVPVSQSVPLSFIAPGVLSAFNSSLRPSSGKAFVSQPIRLTFRSARRFVLT